MKAKLYMRGGWVDAELAAFITKEQIMDDIKFRYNGIDKDIAEEAYAALSGEIDNLLDQIMEIVLEAYEDIFNNGLVMVTCSHCGKAVSDWGAHELDGSMEPCCDDSFGRVGDLLCDTCYDDCGWHEKGTYPTTKINYKEFL